MIEDPEDLSADPYHLLGLAPAAGAAEIRAAYRRLARRWHPDANRGEPEAAERFKAIAAAYRQLAAALKAPGPEAQGSDGAFRAAGTEAASGLDLDLGALGPAAAEPGGDIAVTLDLSLEEAYRGGRFALVYERRRACLLCQGHGAIGEAGTPCAACAAGAGSGAFAAGAGSEAPARCRRCHGRGRVFAHPCPDCAGAGGHGEKTRIELALPPGIDDGDGVTLSGRGHDGRAGGAGGALRVRVRIAPHPRFERRGDDLYLHLALTSAQAIFGGALDLPTLEGPCRVELAPGAANETRLRFAGLGMPRKDASGRGDLHALPHVADDGIEGPLADLIDGLLAGESKPAGGRGI